MDIKHRAENKCRLSLRESSVFTFFRGAKDDNGNPRGPKRHIQQAAIFATLLTWLVILPAWGDDDAKTEPDSDAGFVSLYNGSDLTGWKTTGNWQPQDDGVLALNPRDGEEGWKRFSSYLWAEQQYGDFSCDFEYKHEEGGNSGFYLRVEDADDPVATGIEIQIIDSHGKKGLKKGKLTAHSCTGGVIRTKAAPSKNMTKPAGEWNRMIVTCIGNHLQVQLNGEQVTDIKLDQTKLRDRPASGFIGIQDHGLPFQVRNIRIHAPANVPLTAEPSEAQAVRKPNILLILADDFGWGDASCNNPDSPLRTPAIDRIADEGIRFTNAHTPSAVCTPTRYGLLTGRYPWRSYMKSEVVRYYAPPLIAPGRTTLASFLKSQGYKTGGFGKWHLGLDWTPMEGDPLNWRSRWTDDSPAEAAATAKGIDHTKPFQNGPTDLGFDSYFGTASNCSRLPFYIEDDHVVGNPQPDKQGLMRDPECARDKVDDVYVEKAIEFIESSKKQNPDRPFFVYLPLNAIHGAVGVPKRYAGTNGMSKREDKIPWADENVGEMLTALDRLKLTEDTLVIFTTDNGPLNSPDARKGGHEPTGPYRGYKTCAWDGGTRVPFVARWPGHIPVGATTDHLIGLTDVLATVAELCGQPLPAGAGPDSVSQLPALLQQSERITQRPNLVTATYRGLLTIRQDNWKAIFGTKWSGGHSNKNYGGKGPDKLMDDPNGGQLYNLTNDPYEQNDLWESRPEVVAKLRDELERIKQLDKSDPPPSS